MDMKRAPSARGSRLQNNAFVPHGPPLRDSRPGRPRLRTGRLRVTLTCGVRPGERRQGLPRSLGARCAFSPPGPRDPPGAHAAILRPLLALSKWPPGPAARSAEGIRRSSPLLPPSAGPRSPSPEGAAPPSPHAVTGLQGAQGSEGLRRCKCAGADEV